MLRPIATLATVTVLTACDLGVTDLGDQIEEALCGGPCPSGPLPGPPVLAVSGEVYIGEFLASRSAEFAVHLYSPTDTVTPLRSTGDWGGYFFDFGHLPTADACRSLVRAERWDGVMSELEPLFQDPAAACRSPSPDHVGPALRLPAYAPMDEPFTIWGRVWVDGRPAGAGEMEARIDGPFASAGSVRPRTDGSGRFSYSTTDRRAWVWLCLQAQARVAWSGGDPSGGATVELREIPLRACGRERRLPDTRLGSTKAVWGKATVDGARVAEGAVQVELLRASDSTVVGAPELTYDDGYFHVYFPHGLAPCTTVDCDPSRPGCGWLVRAGLVRRPGTEVIHPRSGGCSYPSDGVYQEFSFDP
jgi:hypothetical protein